MKKETLKKKNTSRKKRGLLLLLLFLFAYGALFSGLTVTEYRIDTGKVDRTVRIVLVTDLHSCLYGKNQEALIEKIKAQKPDLLLMAGDIADDINPLQGTTSFLAGIKDLCPAYYVTGNHEFRRTDLDAVLQIFEKNGVTVLRNAYAEMEIDGSPLIIAGIDDPERHRKETTYNQAAAMQTAFGDLAGKDGFKILLAHRPEAIEEYRKYPFDLVVSGHAHGGQVRIPFLLDGLFAPDQGFFPKYAGGIYHHGTLTHVVSRGLSKNLLLPRVFNPPEIVVIDLVREI